MINTFLSKTGSLLIGCCLLTYAVSAHNGKVAYAYPLGKITIDGHLTDWPSQFQKYMIGTHMSDTKPGSANDFSGYFQIGYRADNKSLYIAFTITDDDFIEDTTAQVRFNTQDGLELSIDARHLPTTSGVAAFMYSKKLRNTNLAYYDPFAKNASWDIMEVAMTRQGNKRFYEWRIMLGDQLVVGKSLGFDFLVFDKDTDNSFSYTGWGKGERRYVNPNSLGDVILLPANTKLATITGKVAWDRPSTEKLPAEVCLRAVQNPSLWLETAVDTLGNYSVSIPPGPFDISFTQPFFMGKKDVYAAANKKPVEVKAGQKINAPQLILSTIPAPDLVPEKGILHSFTTADAGKVDQFITTYQQYFNIPGVSLALIKDGKVVYHKTYGVSNTFTGEPVNNNTLFEAASITKPVFAFAVQRLAERGVIDLNKPLYEYLPYPDIAYDDRYKLMTAKHVLTHRTGFPNWRWMNADGKLNLKFTPGTSYNYSGEGFEYLKLVIEKITGKKVEQVLQEEVIEPMQLYHTFFSRNDSLQRVVANGHFDMIPSQADLPPTPGMAYSMHTEAAVFTRFMLYLLEQKGLSPQTYETMFQMHSEYTYDSTEEKPAVPAYMGMSLEVRETAFGKTFGHGGNNGDFKCQFEVYKDIKMGYATFTNSNTSDPLLRNLRLFLVEGKDTKRH